MQLLRHIFEPKPELSEQDTARGLKWLTWEGMASMGFGSITGSGFLTAFALLLGANNLQIGILAAIPFATMPLQVLTVALVERLRRRKVIALTAWAAAQVLWLPAALIPLFLNTPGGGAVSVLLGIMLLRGILVAVQNSAWNSWMREIVPVQAMGSFFARRLAYAQVAAMVFGMGAALFVDYWQNSRGESEAVYGYTLAIVFGAVFLGLASPVFRALMPEPQMPESPEGKAPLTKLLAEPFRDPNYTHVIRFMLLWNLATQLAAPFFVVYMLTVLGLSVTAVMALAVLGQASNILFLRMWGPLSDRVGAKPVLSLSASLYLLVILGWTFTTAPDRYFLTMPLLIVLHIMMGAAAAGVNITSGTVALKLAPHGKTTAYLSAQSVAANIGAAVGPLVGGTLIDFFEVRSLSLDFTWTDPDGSTSLSALSLSGYDFMFVIAFVIGLFTLQFLAALREEGEVSREAVLETLMSPMQRLAAPASTIPGLGMMTQAPYNYLRRVPVPGFDVAMGITAYQVAESLRLATSGAEIGWQRTGRLAARVSESVRQIVRRREGAEDHLTEVARSAAMGAAQGISELDTEGTHTTEVITEAVKGVVQGVAYGHEEAKKELVDAAVYGAVQGALQKGADPVEVTDAAIEAAHELGSGAEADELAELAKDAAQRAVSELAGEAEAERIE